MKLQKHCHPLFTMLLMLCIIISSSTFSDVLAANKTELDISKGNITLSASAVSGKAPDGTDVTTANSEGYIIIGTTVDNRIIVESGAVNLALQGVDMQMQNAVPAILVKPGASLSLDISEDNTLVGGVGYAAISVAPAYDASWNYLVDDSASLTLTGDGIMRTAGGSGLKGNCGGGAGIGGDGQNEAGDGVDFGSIIISDEFTGSLIATGGADGYDNDGVSYGGGAGIGSGGMNSADYYWGTVYGNILIQNGNIEATTAGSGAGIGSGSSCGYDTVASQMNITIMGGTVTATGGTLGAGIGGGSACDGGFISISDGTVTAQAGNSDGSMGGAGIGGGNDAAPSSIVITGGTVDAYANGGGAGIGGGTNTTYSYVFDYDTDKNGHVGNKGIITISGENTTVHAYGGTGKGDTGTFGGAGIGSGYPVANNQRSVAFDISITDNAEVYAHGGYHAQAVGYGFRPNTSDPNNYYTGYGITSTLDDTITLWALNTDFHQPALVAATKYDSSPIAYFSSTNHLVRYTDVDRAATSASTDVATGHLDTAAANDSVDIGWSFWTPILTLSLNEIDYGFTTDAQADTEITGNWATLLPIFTSTDITVSYQWVSTDNPTDVTPLAPTIIAQGTAYTAQKQAATSEQYKFDGWYTDENCAIKYVDSTVLTEDTTLYGKWSKLSDDLMGEIQGWIWLDDNMDGVKDVTETSLNVSNTAGWTVEVYAAGTVASGMPLKIVKIGENEAGTPINNYYHITNILSGSGKYDLIINNPDTMKYIFTRVSPGATDNKVLGTASNQHLTGVIENSTAVVPIAGSLRDNEVYNIGLISGSTKTTLSWQSQNPTKGTVAITGADSGSPTTSSGKCYETIGARVDVTAATGYTFAGWATSDTGSVDFNILKTGPYGANGRYGYNNIGYYAVFTPNSYTISYENLNGTSNSNPGTYTYGEGVSSLVNPGIRAGYTFTGWYDEENAGNKVTSISGTTTENVRLYARWMINSYTVSFNSGANGTMIGIATESVNHGKNVTSVPSIIAGTGYLFSGWSDGIGIYSEDVVKNYVVTGNVTFTAQYVDSENATVIFNFGDGKVDDKNSSKVSGKPGTSYSVPLPARNGYTISGWSPGIPDKIYGEAGSTTTYTAQWLADRQTVTYKANGGTGSDFIEDSNYDAAYTVTALDATGITSNGYTFKAWNTKADGSGMSYAGGDTVLITGDVTLYAQWEKTPSGSAIPSDKSGASGTAKSPKTGDSSNMMLWRALLCASLAGVGYLMWMIYLQEKKIT